MSVVTQTFFFTQTVRLYPLPSLYYVGINFGREVLGMDIRKYLQKQECRLTQLSHSVAGIL